MKDECIKAVTDAAGRALSSKEIQGIEDRITAAQRSMAQKYRQQYLGMTPEQRLRAAGLLAAQQLEAEASKAKQRVALTIAAHDRMENYLASEKQRGVPMMEAIERKLRKFNDGKSMTSDVWYNGQARGNLYLSRMLETLETTAPKAFGLFSNKEGIKAFTYELFHLTDKTHPESTSFLKNSEAVKAAKDAAKQWHDTSETTRKAFNERGGEVGKLEDWHMPQSHNQNLVFMAGKDKWLSDIYPMLDPKRYLNEDGSRMTDQQMHDFLGDSWKTIATGGANKATESTSKMPSALSRRYAEERVLHFKDADGYLNYMDKYGRVDLFSNMVGHVQRMGRDITMLETFGPNPSAMFDFWKNKAMEEAANSGDKKQMDNIDGKAQKMSRLYDYVAGKSQPIANRYIAQFFDTWRNLLGSAMLGSAPFTALKDIGNGVLTSVYNHTPVSKFLGEMAKNHNPVGFKDRMRAYQRAGLALDVYTSEMNRFGNDALGALWSKKLNNLTHRLSGMVATDGAKRSAMGTLMYSTLGEAAEKHETLADVPAGTRRILESKGVDEKTFQVWKMAEKENWGKGNDTVLTPESIYRIPDEKLSAMTGTKEKPIDTVDHLREEAAVKLLGHALSEMDMVVPYTGAEQAKYTGNLMRGTIRDELFRSIFLFKGFALSDMERHFLRGWNMPDTVGKVGYLAGFMALSTVLGAIGTQLYETINGRNPLDMSDRKFWARAVLKGGGLGIYGDFLFGDQTQSYGGGFLATLAGPQLGMFEQLYNLTVGAVRKEVNGQKVDEGANLVRFIKSNIPLQNLWYTRAVTDRLIFNQIQEMLSPGYMGRVEDRARKEFGQSYWWKPNQVVPTQAPQYSH